MGLLETAKYGFSAHLRRVEQDLKEKRAAAAALARVQKWCALRDRTMHETHVKLREVASAVEALSESGSKENWVEECAASLAREGYVDDTRCAESYTRTHLEHKSWGPLKIKAGLASRGVSGAVADRAIAEVPQGQWQDAVDRLVQRRASEVQDHRDRVIRWLLQRGFPQRMVWTSLDSLSSDNLGEESQDS